MREEMCLQCGSTIQRVADTLTRLPQLLPHLRLGQNLGGHNIVYEEVTLITHIIHLGKEIIDLCFQCDKFLHLGVIV
ncbi:hypothetical protein D9C01_02800 [Corynebacterium diphtheriae]|nr:hypothetical protein D9B34_02820 [Corynebacterium diphtheriae]RKX05750.1 hypothetical protein D9C01_02800 [Corynebacterium diphtheriae]RNF49443.1 hypothetical protein EFE07_02680 [Corynebacterium diphtheriae]